MKKKNKSDAIRKFKEYILLSARLSLLKKGMVPASKKDTFELYQKLEKIDIKKIYEEVNEKNIKELVTKYVG